MKQNKEQQNTPRQAGYDQTRTAGKEYQNIETSVNNPNYFDEDYANDQEDQMASRDARTEDEGTTGKN
jgi:hypothetical protein